MCGGINAGDLTFAGNVIAHGSRPTDGIHLICLATILVVLNKDVCIAARVNDSRKQTVCSVLKLPGGSHAAVKTRSVCDGFGNEAVRCVVRKVQLQGAERDIGEQAAALIIEIINATGAVNHLSKDAAGLIPKNLN